MRNSKKELQLMADLAQAILQYRIDRPATLNQHFKQLRKQNRKMKEQGTFQTGIAHLLAKNDSYKVKSRLSKHHSGSQLPLRLGIRVRCLRKADATVFNEQFWDFQMLRAPEGSFHAGNSEQLFGAAICEAIEFVLRNLLCSQIFPFGAAKKNKFLMDYQLFLKPQTPCDLSCFQNVETKQVWGLCGNDCFCFSGLSLKFYSNSSRVSEELSEIIAARTEMFKQRERKYSIGSTQASSEDSDFSQHYDNVRILQESIEVVPDREETFIELVVDPEEQEEEEFVMLTVENTLNFYDNKFNADNEIFLKQLAELEEIANF